MRETINRVLCMLLMVSMVVSGLNTTVTAKAGAEPEPLVYNKINSIADDNRPEYMVTVNQKIKSVYGGKEVEFRYITSEKVNLSDSVITYNSSKESGKRNIRNYLASGTDFLNDCSSEYGFSSLADFNNVVAMQNYYKSILNALTEFYSDTKDISLSTFGSDKEFCITKVDYQSQDLTINEAQLVLQAVMFDHPLFYWISNIMYYDGWEIYIIADGSYAIGEVRQIYSKEIKDFITSYQSGIDGCGSNYEIARFLHDSVINRVTYALDQSGNPIDDAYAYNIIGCVNNNIRKVVCEGYSETYQALLNYYDIDNALATGWGVGSSGDKSPSNSHMWNVIKMGDNKYYYADLTWDDQLTEYTGTISYQYFLKGSSILTDHTLATAEDFSDGYYSYKLVTSDTDYAQADTSLITQRDPEYNVYGSIQWELSDGILTISGSGSMQDYRSTIDGQDTLISTPWEDDKDSIKKIVIKEGITYIGSDSFANCGKLEAVELPGTLETIGNFAFLYCTKLNDVKLPSGLKKLGQQAFFGCSSLTQIIIPDSVNFIDAEVFGKCIALTYVFIDGGSINSQYIYSNGLFSGCESLENIQVSEKHDTFISVDGVLYGIERSLYGSNEINYVLVQYPSGKKDENYTTIEGTISVLQNAVGYNKYIKNFICSEGVKEVGAANFKASDSLTYLEFPSTLTSCNETFADNQIDRIVNKSNTPISLVSRVFLEQDGYGEVKTCRRYWRSLSTGKQISVLSNDTATAYYPVVSIAVTASCDIKVGESKQIEVLFTPKKTDETKYSIISSDTRVAAIKDGCVVGVKSGTVKVTVISAAKDNIRTVITVNVKGEAPSVKAPVAPAVKSVVSNEKGVVKITWGKVSDVSGYEIIYSTSSNFTKDKVTKTAGSKELSRKITGLRSNKTYYIKIRAYKTVNGKKYYSSYSKVKSITVK